MGHRDTTGDTTYKSSVSKDISTYSPQISYNQAIQNKYPTGSRSNFSTKETTPSISSVKGSDGKTYVVRALSSSTVDLNTYDKNAGLA